MFYPEQKWNLPEPKIYTGRFQPNGTSAIDNTKNKGPGGWTVAYSATGIYTVTFSGKHFQCIIADGWHSTAAPQDAEIQVGAIDVVIAKTVIFKCVKTSDGSTAVALANDADTWIHFMVVVAGLVGK